MQQLISQQSQVKMSYLHEISLQIQNVKSKFNIKKKYTSLKRQERIITKLQQQIETVETLIVELSEITGPE